MKTKVSICDIHKHYGNHEVLKGVSLTAAAGDVISIIGSSGSGKSTLLRCINLLETPNAGQIIVDGETIKLKPSRDGQVIGDKAQVRRMRSRLSMVFQHFNLWAHMTALENVVTAPVNVLRIKRKEAIERAKAYLDKVGLDAKVHDKYPIQLSGGQRQRVAIARALALEPEVLLFDEPTSALDPELVGEVLKVMRDLAAEQRTMIVVTHEMGFAEHVSNRVVFVHQGKIEVEGESTRVLQSPTNERLQKFLSNNYK